MKRPDVTSQWGFGILTQVISDIVWIADILFCGQVFEDVEITLWKHSKETDWDLTIDSAFIFHVWAKDVPHEELGSNSDLSLYVNSAHRVPYDVADFIQNITRFNYTSTDIQDTQQCFNIEFMDKLGSQQGNSLPIIGLWTCDKSHYYEPDLKFKVERLLVLYQN